MNKFSYSVRISNYICTQDMRPFVSANLKAQYNGISRQFKEKAAHGISKHRGYTSIRTATIKIHTDSSIGKGNCFII